MEAIYIPVLANLLFQLILLFPMWKIFAQAGQNPQMSLLLLIPVFGFFAASMYLAFTDWYTYKGVNTK